MSRSIGIAEVRRRLFATAGGVAVAAAVVLGPVFDFGVAAQAPLPPAFDVASVKPNKSGSGGVNVGNLPGGRFTATNVPVAFLLRQAFQVQPSQIIGAPKWADSDRFDIVAKAPDGTPPGQMPPMIRTLLLDRFKLVFHNETRELPIFALLPARSDGSLGPQLKPAGIDCAALFAARGRGGPPAGGPGGGPPPSGPPTGAPGGAAGRGAGRDGPDFSPGNRPPCAQLMGPGSIAGSGMTMAQLAAMLSVRVNRVVVDRTGLAGSFDLDLAWTPDQIPQGPGAVAPPGAPPLPSIDPDGPSLFTAVQEQLGLKLDSTKGPADVIVIDSIEHPEPD
jgi:uncharacterized protein (TIGR03435 family)